MFTTTESENYSVKLPLNDWDENYYIFVKGAAKKFIVGLWDVVYNDNDIEGEEIFDISELSAQDLQSLDMDSLIEKGYKILF